MELLEHGLKDMYDAEQKFAKSLQKMASNADDKALANGFSRHKEVTENQVKRLEDAFECIGSDPQRENCAAANGLVNEYEKFVEEHRGGNGLLDAFAANAGLKVEHYEIASYRGMVDLAEYCGQDEVAGLLRANLAEEEQAAGEMMAASNTLSAKLAGAPVRKIATRAIGTAFDQAREGTMATLGATMGAGRAVAGKVGSAIDRAERRGKKVRTQAKRKTTSAKRKTASTRGKATRRAKSTARKAKSTARRATGTAKRRTGSATSRTPKHNQVRCTEK
jgi:ferritin-like metal-binding protein YciE